MSVSFTVTETCSFAGLSFPNKISVTADGSLSKTATPAAAKTGTLTTRTDDNTGELTMSASHGITTGARLDVYWTGGSRRGMTVGTVATNAVPIDGGAGDALPADETAITAMVPTEEEFLFTGNNLKALAMFTSGRGTIVLADSSDGELMAKVLEAETGGIDQCYLWTPDRDATNPVSGDDVAKVFFSHASSSGTATMRVAAAVD